jgi:tetratricopeptide (TPR) repeat protein
MTRATSASSWLLTEAVGSVTYRRQTRDLLSRPRQQAVFGLLRGTAWAIAAIALLLAGGLQAADSLREDGVAAYGSGRYSVALEKLKGAVARDANDQTSRVFLALTQAALNDCANALPELNKATGAQDTELAQLAGIAAVNCHASAGEDTEALGIAHRLSQRFPNNADVLYTIAKLHMKAFNDATYAMFEHTASSYRVHELSAEIFEVDHRYTDAAAEYRKAIALNSKAPNLHFRLGRALLLESHDAAALEAAKREFQAELQLSPEDSACEFQLGQIAQALGKRDEAKQHFGRALELSPSFAEALVALGKIDAQEKRFPEAIKRLQRATGLEPANENAHYALMMVYRDSGQMAQAKAEKAVLDKLQKPPEGEFTNFLKKLGEKPPEEK